MHLSILLFSLAIAALELSSAAVLRQNELAPGNPSASRQDISNNGQGSPLIIHAVSPAPPEVQQTHTLSNTDKTVLTVGDSEIVNQLDQSSNSRTSPSGSEVFDEVNQTYGIKLADERAVSQTNHVHDYAYDQSPDGVNHVYMKEGTDTVFAVDNSKKGERQMIGTSKSNTGEQISLPNGIDHTFLVAEDQDLHQIEDKNGLRVDGKTEKDLVYMAGTSDNVDSFYQINSIDQDNLDRNDHGVQRDSKQSSLTGFGYTDEVTEALAVDDVQNTITVNNKGAEASVGVGTTNKLYNSVDANGNQDILVIDDTAHNINVKDGNIGVSLTTKNTNDVYGSKDQDGTITTHEGNGIDHSLSVTDGELTAQFDLNQINELFGTSTADGVDEVHQVNQTGKSVMLDNGARGVAIGVNEIDATSGLFDNGDIKASYQSNQVDKVMAVDDGSSGSSLQTSEMNGILQVKDDNGEMQTVSTGGQMTGQTVVIGDDQIDGAYEAVQVDESFWIGSVEASDVAGYQESKTTPAPYLEGMSFSRPEIERIIERPPILKETDLSTPGADYQTPDVIIIQQGVTVNEPQSDSRYRPSDAYESTTSAFNSFNRLVNKFDELYRVGDFGRIGRIFGGSNKRKVDMQIAINMEIE